MSSKDRVVLIGIPQGKASARPSWKAKGHGLSVLDLHLPEDVAARSSIAMARRPLESVLEEFI